MAGEASHSGRAPHEAMAAGGGGGAEGGGKVRGYIDGCFDIMHSGHYNAIRQAKCLCDVLVVGVHSDKVIEANKAMPVMRQAERYELLNHIKWIDEIVHDVPYSPELATLELAKADFCVHGDDMPVNAQGVCAYQEMMDAGRLRIIKRTEGVSTTDLIGRLLTLSRGQHQRGCAGLPSEGVKVAASDVDFGASVAGSASSAPPASASLDRALELLDDLVARSRLSPADAQPLQQQLSAARGALFDGGPAPAGPDAPVGAPPEPEANDVGGQSAEEEREAQLRTRVPVQLLTSTRRITEFSSARQPATGDVIVYVSGSFDMFHVGHAQFLKDARALGTFLFVGLHDDLAVSASKGANFPVMTLNERVLNVCACKWVDEVIIGAPRCLTADLVKTWNIHVVARSCGHQRDGAPPGDGDDGYGVARSMGIYREVPSKWPELCHETIVRRIISDRDAYLRRNRDRAAKEDVYYMDKAQGTSPLEV